MKLLSKTVKTGGVIALVALLVGCATTTMQTTDLLVAAGFQVREADTPEKQKLLQSLPAGQVSRITWKGKTYYVEPDGANNRAYVGTEANYQSYQNLRLAKQISNDNLMAAQMNQMQMDSWSAWGPGFYGGVYGAGRIGRFR